jgi:pimeloyl-ACP methyl ester carboxylesterase
MGKGSGAERIEANGVELAYERRGEGPPVVFVHGLGGSRRAWLETAGLLADEGFQGIAMDLRGAGESDKPPGPYSVEGWSQDLIALLDDLRIDRPVLVGHSVGCMVVEHAALALEDRCAGLAMLGGAVRWADGFEAVLTERAELARSGRLNEVAEAVAAAGLSQKAHDENPELVSSFIESFSSQDPEGYAESALATARASMVEPEAIRCPALAFAGTEDAVTPPNASKEVAAAMPRGEFTTIDGGAHWCLIERPDGVAERLLGFLRSATIG